MKIGDEVWKPIPDFPGYFVSNFGQVSSPRKSRLKLVANHTHGRLFVTLYRKLDTNDYVKVAAYVHLLVADAFLGPCPAGKVVRHRDNNFTNNRWDNLNHGTLLENNHDMRGHGTNGLGENSTRSKVDALTVVNIRRDRRAGLTQKELRAKYDIYPVEIYQYESWNPEKYVRDLEAMLTTVGFSSANYLRLRKEVRILLRDRHAPKRQKLKARVRYIHSIVKQMKLCV